MFFLLFFYAHNRIILLIVDFNTVGIMGETGKFPVKSFQSLQISEQRAVGRTGIFAGHQQRNSRRIRHNAGRHGSTGHFIELQGFYIILNQLFISFDRG